MRALLTSASGWLSSSACSRAAGQCVVLGASLRVSAHACRGTSALTTAAGWEAHLRYNHLAVLRRVTPRAARGQQERGGACQRAARHDRPKRCTQSPRASAAPDSYKIWLSELVLAADRACAAEPPTEQRSHAMRATSLGRGCTPRVPAPNLPPYTARRPMPPTRKPQASSLRHLHGMHDNPSGQRAAATAAPCSGSRSVCEGATCGSPSSSQALVACHLVIYTAQRDAPRQSRYLRAGKATPEPAACGVCYFPLASSPRACQEQPVIVRALGQASTSWNIHCPRAAALQREAPARPRRTPPICVRRGVSRRSAKVRH